MGPRSQVGIDETRSFKISRKCARKRMVAPLGSTLGARNVEELQLDGRCRDEPMDVEVPPEPCAAPSDTPDGMPVEEPASAKPSPRRRISACSELGGMTDDLGTMKPTPAVNPP